MRHGVWEPRPLVRMGQGGQGPEAGLGWRLRDGGVGGFAHRPGVEAQGDPEVQAWVRACSGAVQGHWRIGGY